MRQYLDAKRQYRDAILFFRMGDFYEMFYEDAVTAARALELTLTSRSKDSGGSAIPMCGVPFHALDGYIGRLVKKGFRVAICDQVENPKNAKGVVKREVTRVVSPGTLTDASYLDAREPAFMMAIIAMGVTAAKPASATTGSGARRAGASIKGDTPSQSVIVERFGTALIDLSTGEFSAAEYVAEAGRQSLNEEIQVLRPREIIVPADLDLTTLLPEIGRLSLPVTRIDEWTVGFDRAQRTLLRADADREPARVRARLAHAAVCAAGALVQYLRDTQKVDLAHVRAVGYRERTDWLLIDPTTYKHLEVVDGAEGGRDGSLLNVLDRTQTAMGARMLRGWLLRPLVSLERIQDRLDAVEEFAFRTAERGRLRETLKAVHDLERLVARTALGTAGPRDLARAAPVARRHSARAAAPRRVPGAARQEPPRRARRPRRSARRDRRDDRRRAAGARARRRRDPRRRRSRLDELRTISRSGKAHIASMEEAETRADRHQLAEDPLQPRLRLLHRDHEGQPAPRAGRLSPQADHRRRRTLRHAGAEGIRREGARRGREDSRTRDSTSSSACARGLPRKRRASRIRRARSRRSTCSPRSATPRRSTTTPSR